jgi:hypothetical protein
VHSPRQDGEGLLACETRLLSQVGEVLQRCLIVGGVARNIGRRACGSGDEPTAERQTVGPLNIELAHLRFAVANVKPGSFESGNAHLPRWGRSCAEHPQSRLLYRYGVSLVGCIPVAVDVPVVADVLRADVLVAGKVASHMGIESQTRSGQFINRADDAVGDNGVTVTN